MSAVNDNLVPVLNNHSIKEAVITVFLVSKIIKPEEFKQLIAGKLKSKFVQFETTNHLQVKVESECTFINPIPNNGFNFINYRNGSRADILRGINEDERQFFSFHSLMYENWSSFKRDFLDNVKILAEFQPNFAKAFSIHYIDEFSWKNRDSYQSDFIFRRGGVYLPDSFFETPIVEFSLNTEKSEGNEKYFDRLSINVENKISEKSILISHNSSYMLHDTLQLSDLLEREDFKTMLDSGHKRNKLLLNEILEDDVKQLIGIL